MVLLFVLLLSLLSDSNATTNFKKADSCPSSIIHWRNRERMFACPAETPYHCILMYNTSQLYEGCMAGVTIGPEEEGCPWILIHKGTTPIHGSIHSECPVSNPECPPAHHRGYKSNQLYQYPACFLPRSERNPAIQDSTTSRPIRMNMPKTSSPPSGNGVSIVLISVLVIAAFVGVVIVVIVVSVVVLKRKKGGTSQFNQGTHQKIENETMKHIEEEIHTLEFTTENEQGKSDNVDEVLPLLFPKECTNSNDPGEGLQLISTKGCNEIDESDKENKQHHEPSAKGCNEIDESDKENKQHHEPSAKDTQKESSTSNEKDNTRVLKDNQNKPPQRAVVNGSKQDDDIKKQRDLDAHGDTQKESSTSNEKDDTKVLKDYQNKPPQRAVVNGSNQDVSMHRVAISMETGNSVPNSEVTLGKHTATFQTGIARDVIKTILDTPNGVAEYQHVLMTLLEKGLQDGKVLETLLKENGHIFHHLEQEGNISFVAPYLFDVQICNDYQKSSLTGKCEKQTCESFHICYFFMRGICKRSDCKYSHTYSDAHNSQIKERLLLSSYSDSEINKLLGNQYPKICPKWSCLEDSNCPYLHVCLSFCMANCKYGNQCRRSHSIETEHNRWILQAYDISPKSIRSGSYLAKQLVLAKS